MSPQEKREPRQDTDLTPLTESYELVAELRGRENGRAFIGKRRDDGRDVLVFLLRATRETGDRDDLATSDRKSLTLFAADAKLLAGLSHRNMLPIVDARWVGQQAFAVITERTGAPTLEELIEREGPLPTARIAEILREINGLLEWARAQQVAHRGVRPDTLFVEPGTDRVLATFVMRPLPVSGAIEPEADARTIADLAFAMLAGGKEPEREPEPSKEEQSDAPALARLRPDLPSRIVEETERIQNVPDGPDAPTDVLSYLALVAMGDNLKSVEEESARARADLAEELRVAREELETERANFQRTREEETNKAAEERQRLEGLLAEEREKMQAALAKERNELQRTLTGEQERLATEREELQRAIEKERKKLEEARAELERAIASERQEMENERQILERIGGEANRYREETQEQLRELEARKTQLANESKTARERERAARLEAERAAEVTAAELSASAMSDHVELPTPTLDEPVIREPVANVDAIAPSTAAASARGDQPWVAPKAEPRAVQTSKATEPEPELAKVMDSRRSRIRRTVGISAGVVAVTIAAALAAMNYRSSGGAGANSAAKHAVVDSAGGGVALRGASRSPARAEYASVVPLPVPTDSITTALAKVWTPRKRRPKPKPVVVDTMAFDSTGAAPAFLRPPGPPQESPASPQRSPGAPPRSTSSPLSGIDSMFRRDTTAKREPSRPKPDSVVKPPHR